MKTILLAFGLAAAATGAHAEVTRLEITSKQPFGTFAAGDYEIWQGTIHGELSPSENIPGLDKSPRNARGQVEYAARLILIFPTDPVRGNGTLLVDVPNRGGAYAETLYNSPRDDPFRAGTLEQGTGFLQDRGYSLAEVYWELGQGANLPSFVDAQGTRRYIEGAGFAIVRDAADFLAHGTRDVAGDGNPLKGAVKRAIGVGKSQSGRFLRSFMTHGFNRAQARRVFDGVHIFVSQSGQLPIMQTGTGPESSSTAIPSFDNVDLRGYIEEPLTIGEIVARMQARGETPPKMILLNSVSDYYSIRSSLGRTGASGTVDLPIPANVRVYDIAGAPHLIVAKAPPECTLAPGRLDWTPLNRATLLMLDAWIANGTEPPPTRLMPLEPAPADPPALRAPSYMPQAIVQVPKRDADGNSIGGVRLPDIEVPLATYRGQNAPTARGCMLIGATIPFAVAKTERESKGDARLSVAERYRNRDDYVNRIRVASRDLVHAGFLLPEDAAIIIQAAAANPVFARIPKETH
jgi:hypothetical protein